MGTCKTKAIEADLGISTHILTYSGTFRDNQEYPGIIQAWPETIQAYSGIIKTLWTLVY